MEFTIQTASIIYKHFFEATLVHLSLVCFLGVSYIYQPLILIYLLQFYLSG